MKTNRFRTKFTALFLSLVLIWLTIPVGSLELDLSDSVISEDSMLQTNSSALTEDVSRRDKFTKHYVDADGNYYAVVYPEQVHYKENNEWKEVDNTLTYNTTTKRYSTNNPQFATNFANDTTSNQLVSITDGEYTLSWTVSFADNQDAELSTMSISSTEITESSGLTISASTAQVTQKELDGDNEITTTETVGKVGKTKSSVQYKNVFKNSVDLRYSILHGKVEEDIILNSPEGFTSYTLTVNTGGLTAIKLPDNTVIFANEDGEGIFNLGAPWMKDSGVAVSDDINVNVVQRGNYAYITYTPDSEWLNDSSRIYPVLIDPSFTTRMYVNNYEDTYVYTGDSASTTRASEQMMPVGNINGKTYYSYIKILNVSDLIGDYYVNEATLVVHTDDPSPSPLSLYGVDASWSANTITYANQPSSTLIESNVSGFFDDYTSVYTFDITEWLSEQSYNYSSTNIFFESSDWNGFKIGYTTNVSNNYAQIYASEYMFDSGDEDYWTIMVLEYTYLPSENLEDGAVYSFVNSASGKYLTVYGGNDVSGTNICQYTKNNSLSQAFKLKYDETNEAFTIKAMCSSNGDGRELCASYSAAVEETGGYQPTNLFLANDSENIMADSTEWLIQPVGNSGFFKIVMRADGNLALTAYGTGNGTADGKTSTSEGNVFVSEYTDNAPNQLWKIETGGAQVMPSDRNVKFENLYVESNTMYEGSTWITYCCPVMNFGDTVTWSSSNTNVATVNSTGDITAVKAGTAEITATIFNEDGVEQVEYCQTILVVIEDGVYILENVNTGDELTYESLDSTAENTPLTMLDTDGYSYASTAWMFKIKHLGDGTYSIRSMISSDMGLARWGDELVSSYIGYYDDDIPPKSKWYIKSNANGYYLYAIGTQYTMTASTSYGQPVEIAAYSPTNTNQNWRLQPVSDSYNGVTLTDKTNYLLVGESYDFDAGVYSSIIDENGQKGITWSVTNGTGSATINSSTGVLTGTSQGMVTVTATYRRSSSQIWSYSYNVYIATLEEGRYLFQNKDTSKYMQPDDDGNPFMEQHDFNSDVAQRWELIYYGNGYYQIKNMDTGLYLTVPDNTTDGASIIEQAFSTSISSRQLWKLTKLSNGAYKIQAQARENTSLVLAVGWGANWNGINIEQRNYSSDSNYKDEWLLEEIYILTLHHYFDNGYEVYNNQSSEGSKEDIANYQEFVSKVLEELFDIKVKYQIYDNGHTKSKIDLCKGTVTPSNVNSLCTSSNAICGDGYCHDLDQIMQYFASVTANDLKNKNVLWSNNFIQGVFYHDDVDDNRSCEYMGNVYMLERSKEQRVKMGVLLHEVAHLLGARDHYHDPDDTGYNCPNSAICTECGTTKRPAFCIMNESRPSDLLTRNIEDLFCNYCKADILSNIEEYLTQ